MYEQLLHRLGLAEVNSGVYSSGWIEHPSGGELVSLNPATGEPIATVLTASREDYELVLRNAQEGFEQWRHVPAPQRGAIIREFGDMLREHQDDLGTLVTHEVGKIRSEGVGEVQEMIDMCDFAVGLSRQLYGLTIASERPQHRMLEQWHPLGPVGIITAFNFPVAVWAWNATVASICGNTCIWKPSPQTPLTAIAVQNLLNWVLGEHDLPEIFHLCIGADHQVGAWLAEDRRVPLVSATGSCAMGREVGATVAKRLGRSLLELGGNNAIIVTENADLDLALRAVVFAAVGTTGQRCTTVRRLIIHETIVESFTEKLVSAFRSIRIGDPWEEDILMGPMISEQSIENMMAALQMITDQGGQILTGGHRLNRKGFFVEPTIVRAHPGIEMIRRETFAPILYVLTYRELGEAIALQNAVDQGLSSAIFTDRLQEAERFLSAAGSDCGIANVNIGTSGAEIGGAFGGEKDTGGGREAGSDSWKAYMRRQTCTLNWGNNLPLAQGVEFDLKPREPEAAP